MVCRSPPPSGNAAAAAVAVAAAAASTTTTQFASVLDMRKGTFQSIPIEIDSPWLRLMILEWAIAEAAAEILGQ